MKKGVSGARDCGGVDPLDVIGGEKGLKKAIAEGAKKRAKSAARPAKKGKK